MKWHYRVAAAIALGFSTLTRAPAGKPCLLGRYAPLPLFAHKYGDLLGAGWSDILAREGEEVKPYPLLAILGLALGVASPYRSGLDRSLSDTYRLGWSASPW